MKNFIFGFIWYLIIVGGTEWILGVDLAFWQEMIVWTIGMFAFGTLIEKLGL